MHLKRQFSSTKWPVQRKGTKYVARALSHVHDSIPLVIAIRNMLNLARTSREVKKMIHEKHLKINGKTAKDLNDPIKLFNIIEADKKYVLTFLQTGKYTLQPTTSSERLCKVINKKLLKNNKIQLNLHDGTNISSKDKISVGDSLYLDFHLKTKKHISLEIGKEVFIISGKYTGMKGKIKEMNSKFLSIHLEKHEGLTQLNKKQIILI